jgi:hypothetical protein
LAAIENLDPAHWHDILLDGPQRSQQIEKVKTIIRNLGEAGIPVLGYNFSLAGVCGRVTSPHGRGQAITLGMDGPAEDVPIPAGMIWNMIYDRNAAVGVKSCGGVCGGSWKRCYRWRSNRGCDWPHIRTILRWRPCGSSPGWSINRRCISD